MHKVSWVISGSCCKTLTPVVHIRFCVPGKPLSKCAVTDQLFLQQTSGSGVCSKMYNSLLVPEDEIECKTCHCKANACCGQDAEDDSDGKNYWRHHFIRNTIVWAYTS